jgi:hypothetical protein
MKSKVTIEDVVTWPTYLIEQELRSLIRDRTKYQGAAAIVLFDEDYNRIISRLQTVESKIIDVQAELAKRQGITL